MNRLGRLTRKVKMQAGIDAPCAIMVFCNDDGRWVMHLPRQDEFFDTMEEAIEEADMYAESHNVVSIIIDDMDQ